MMRALLKSLGACLLGMLALVFVITLVAPARGRSAASGGSLSERVRSIGTGEAYFSFDTWPDVWGDEDCNITRGDPDGQHAGHRVIHGRWGSGNYMTRGPMTVRLR